MPGNGTTVLSDVGRPKAECNYESDSEFSDEEEIEMDEFGNEIGVRKAKPVVLTELPPAPKALPKLTYSSDNVSFRKIRRENLNNLKDITKYHEKLGGAFSKTDADEVEDIGRVRAYNEIKYAELKTKVANNISTAWQKHAIAKEKMKEKIRQMANQK